MKFSLKSVDDMFPFINLEIKLIYLSIMLSLTKGISLSQKLRFESLLKEIPAFNVRLYSNKIVYKKLDIL